MYTSESLYIFPFINASLKEQDKIIIIKRQASFWKKKKSREFYALHEGRNRE